MRASYVREVVPACPGLPQLHLLGGPWAGVDGQRHDVPEGSKRLVAYLALKGGRVERRVMAGTLWPDAPDARAAGNLRSALWRLRGAGIDVIGSDKTGMWLR